MDNFASLRWYLALQHIVGPDTWWLWLLLCGLAGTWVLGWWWRWVRRHTGAGRLREVVPPVAMMVLGVLMLTQPWWRGLDAWHIQADLVLLGRVLHPPAPVGVGPVRGACPLPGRGPVALASRSGRVPRGTVATSMPGSDCLAAELSDKSPDLSSLGGGTREGE